MPSAKLVKILLPIDPSGTTRACTEAAFGLAERFCAALEVLHPCLAPTQRLPYATELSPVYFEELIDVGRKQADEEERQATDWFEEVLGAHPGVDAELVTVEGLVGPAVALRAKVADVAVLPSMTAAENDFWDLARDAALFRSGRPVLIVPDEAAGPIGESVVIAWKDTVEAVHAIAAAAPFLAAAKHVRLVSVAEDGVEETAGAMAEYLAKTGVVAKTETLQPGAREVGVTLLEAAGSGALLVMGGYGHWRWREWVFGGATLHVLRNADGPVLMAH